MYYSSPGSKIAIRDISHLTPTTLSAILEHTPTSLMVLLSSFISLTHLRIPLFQVRESLNRYLTCLGTFKLTLDFPHHLPLLIDAHRPEYSDDFNQGFGSRSGQQRSVLVLRLSWVEFAVHVFSLVLVKQFFCSLFSVSLAFSYLTFLTTIWGQYCFCIIYSMLPEYLHFLFG